MNWLKRNRLWLVLLGLAALLGYTLWPDAQRVSASEAQLSNIESLDEPRTQFNRDAGHPRLILLLSPTSASTPSSSPCWPAMRGMKG